MYGLISQSIDQILRVIYQPICPICEKLAEVSGLCLDCNPFAYVTESKCGRCSSPLPHPSVECGRCKDHLSKHILSVCSPLILNEASLKLLHLIKFQKRREWLSLYKELVENTLFPWPLEQASLVPIPMYPDKFLSRGFNQSEILASWIHGKNSQLPVCHGLEKLRATAPQSSLKKFERTKNLSRSFGWSTEWRVPETAILVDDVYTTGETLNACARTLKKEGVQTIYAWTLFRTPEFRIQ